MCTQGLLGLFWRVTKTGPTGQTENFLKRTNQHDSKKKPWMEYCSKEFFEKIKKHPLMVLHFGKNDSNKNTDSTRGESHHMASRIRSIGSNHQFHPFLGGQSEKTSQSSKFKHNQTLKQHKHKLKIQKQKTPPKPPETPIKIQKNEENSSLTARLVCLLSCHGA